MSLHTTSPNQEKGQSVACPTYGSCQFGKPVKKRERMFRFAPHSHRVSHPFDVPSEFPHSRNAGHALRGATDQRFGTAHDKPVADVSRSLRAIVALILLRLILREASQLFGSRVGCHPWIPWDPSIASSMPLRLRLVCGVFSQTKTATHERSHGSTSARDVWLAWTV